MMTPTFMSQLLALSFDTQTSPTILMANEDEAASTDDSGPSGWGFGWYPGDDRAAAVIKDPIRTGPTAMSRVLHDWERFRGTQFVCHIRGAAKRSSEQDTQPFSRSFAGRDWIFAHNGDLVRGAKQTLVLPADTPFEPVGHTDSEHAFCWLLSQIRNLGARRLADVDWDVLQGLLRQINNTGAANLLVADGQDLVAYRDKDSFNTLHYLRRIPPHGGVILRNQHIELRLDHVLDETRSMVIVSTMPLSDDEWIPMQPGQMLVTRLASIQWISDGMRVPNFGTSTMHNWAMKPQQSQLIGEAPSSLAQQSQTAPANERRAHVRPDGSRIMVVTHKTEYRYDSPIELSSHLFRLRPVQDMHQEVLDFEFTISPKQQIRVLEDVFGNQGMRVKIDKPYSTLTLEAKSKVLIHASETLSSPTRRTSIPLVWMPWQRQMMLPYLLPSELPETQLQELSDFAMSFVERQDYNLVNTLLDINETIFKDFSYVSGSTTLQTTPFEVYSKRRGVCQDFANLFICLARLLSVPARYRVGYIYTGGYENKVQSDASHAWAEVYLPWRGWLGFDPTNGVVVGLDHVRVACGRNYRDASPTSGTIFKGGGTETLSVNVRVDIVEE